VRIGVDTGGTFTDVVLYAPEDRAVTTAKTASTPPDFERGVLTGIDTVLERTGTAPGEVAFLSHGTTVGTNAVLEGDLPRLGLLTNEGLRDVLEIGDQTRPALYDLQVEKPQPPVPRRRRYGVPGRIDHAGEVVDPLDEDAVRAAVRELSEQDVTSIVVSMLFSHLNDSHERRVAELIEAEAPALDFALSSAVYPESREYERTVTTVLNEAVKARTADYFGRLRDGVTERGIDAPLYVMHSGGGIFDVEAAIDYALRTVLSGPAAGAVGAREASAGVGIQNAIGLDMGGTSADVSLVEGGDLVRSTEGEINDLPIKTPLIDINTVGAGGGSVAWVDAGGGLRVGPASAGADPGPICYDRGGERPTVTDAQVLLGRIDPGAFADGDRRSLVGRIRGAIERDLASPLSVTAEEAAVSVLQVANAKMARELRRVTVERGRDPEDFALVAFGGAGPLHAPAVARHVGLETVIVPRSPGVLSARGLLLADVRMDESAATRTTALDPSTLETQFASLEASIADRLRDGGFDPEAAVLRRTVDMRYRGQSYELQVPLDGRAIDEAALESLRDRFDDRHAQRYGHAMPDEPIEIVTLRVAGSIELPGLEEQPSSAEERLSDQRSVQFAEGQPRETPVHDRTSLDPGTELEGPAIIEHTGSTALIPPWMAGRVEANGALVIQ
jgi:N-methylhydantoinase A